MLTMGEYVAITTMCAMATMARAETVLALFSDNKSPKW